jgi:hypothetical protein
MWAAAILLSHFTVGFIPNRSIIQPTKTLRKHCVSRIESQSSPLPVLEYSASGYIRLTYTQFCALHFPRRLSTEDDDLRRELADQALPAFCAGYCDWVDDTTAVQVSVGWAWFIADRHATQQLAPGGFSSNVMFVSLDGVDLGTAKTNELLANWLAGIPWQAFTGFDDVGNANLSGHALH